MSVLGVNYLQYQTGQAIDDAAKNPSGGAGTTAGLGAGLGVGYAIGGQMGQGMGMGMGGIGQTRSCSNCGSIIPLNSKFCPNCGTTMVQPQAAGPPGSKPKFCPECGTAITTDAKFCPNCGKQL
jgi:RNA polymerase subunit RPABC4/transcription elongation factor Spt4